MTGRRVVAAKRTTDQYKHDATVARLKDTIQNQKRKNEILLDKSMQLEKKLAFYEEISSRNPNIHDLTKMKRGGKCTAVLQLSDWHVEERVDPDTVNDVNSYNPEIAVKRARSIFQRSAMMLDVWRGLSKIEDMVIHLGGDFISGYIHEELEESNYLSPHEAVELAEDEIVSGIRFLRKEAGIKNLTCISSCGNHGRSTKKKRVSTYAKNSYEYAMYRRLAKVFKSYLRDPRVQFINTPGYLSWMDIEGHACRFHHGDYINYKGGVGGITIPVNKAIAQWNKTKYAAVDFFGHFHQAVIMNNWVCNNSLIGYGAYAISIKAEPEEPGQMMSFISPERGKIGSVQIFADSSRI